MARLFSKTASFFVNNREKQAAHCESDHLISSEIAIIAVLGTKSFQHIDSGNQPARQAVREQVLNDIIIDHLSRSLCATLSCRKKHAPDRIQ